MIHIIGVHKREGVDKIFKHIRHNFHFFPNLMKLQTQYHKFRTQQTSEIVRRKQENKRVLGRLRAGQGEQPKHRAKIENHSSSWASRAREGSGYATTQFYPLSGCRW